MITLNLFFGTITLSFQRKMKSQNGMIHQQHVKKMYRETHEKLMNNVHM
ncbi:Probable sporulation protein (Bac_small_yrzI) [Fictibacillus solisalsi]|uniref:Probable sporulation protein (Bac_small_yrzI) n=1 Tax=Fictibacillus solisalsi TaxID=459525 RepID=A0A1G9WNA6_9BACL|nr:YrzI family small protein [Fictibacillus solisalsi]SDM85949.1 Probable sporulation protein (Bac_small_yrzI) [Fictibacillus solisalsi]